MRNGNQPSAGTVTLVGMDAHTRVLSLCIAEWRHGADPEVKGRFPNVMLEDMEKVYGSRVPADAGEASAEIVCNCFPYGAKDFALWAWYCRHFNRRLIIDKAYYYASCHRQGEVRDGVSAFQAWLRKEYGAKPEAGSCMTSQGFSEFINSGSAAGAKGLSAVVGEAAKAGGAA
jgi:hypothetical protein